MFVFSHRLLLLGFGLDGILRQNTRLFGFVIVHFLEVAYIPKLDPAQIDTLNLDIKKGLDVSPLLHH